MNLEEVFVLAKLKSQYICQACGVSFPRWTGKCDACGTWDQIVEEKPSSSAGFFMKKSGSRLDTVDLLTPIVIPKRLMSNTQEFDRVTGGGLVPGGVVLIGGDPGIGKSTLMLQMASRLSHQTPTLYVSGEEAIDQIQSRAHRLGVAQSPLALASSTNLKDIIATIEGPQGAKLVVIDSIQTMFLDDLEASPGTVSQVRACSHELVTIAKKRNVAILIVGHVTKEGLIAGPRVLEHMVDTVLYFEGERGHHYRLLRTVKNRFGATNEIGIFQMTETGLEEVKNPSALFLSERREGVSGSSIYAGLEGTRPVLVEIQVLLSKTAYGMPRRTTVGWDLSRLAMILAVLEARCGLNFANYDVYLNIAGGLKITDPSSDLSIVAALVSAYFDIPLDPKAIFLGEIGLSGEVRMVPHMDVRLKEADKLGFTCAFIPDMRSLTKQIHLESMTLNPVDMVKKLVTDMANQRKNQTTEEILGE